MRDKERKNGKGGGREGGRERERERERGNKSDRAITTLLLEHTNRALHVCLVSFRLFTFLGLTSSCHLAVTAMS